MDTIHNSKYNILVVDDVKNNLLLVKKMLENAHYRTQLASDGVNALRLVENGKVDLILLDIMMPGMSGLEVCRYLKIEPSTASIPVIFLTADTGKETLAKAYGVGGIDYIRKPFFKEELLARVKTTLMLRDYEKNLEQKVADKTKEIQETQVQLMNVLGGIAEGHSKETYAHVKRVTEVSYKLALLSGMSEEEAKLLKDASSLHDIGKLGISDTILHKNGSLTSKEYKEMQKHAPLGATMLEHSSLPLFKAAQIVAGEHHEKYDGSGYPKKLKGEDIHIYGRIVAIADVFDALSFKRAYKERWTTEEVLSYMKDMSGKHFDPKLIELFFDNLNDFLEIYDTQIEREQLEKTLNKKKRNKIIEWLLKSL